MFVARGTLDEARLKQLCEKNYNNRALVPEHTEILRQWEKDAEAFRAWSSSTALPLQSRRLLKQCKRKRGRGGKGISKGD